MNRKIEYSPLYLRKAKKFAKTHPQLRTAYTELLNKLISDPFEPSLHTHPLTGRLKGKLACSLTYDLRIIFTLTDDTIHLLDIGSHDEVY